MVYDLKPQNSQTSLLFNKANLLRELKTAFLVTTHTRSCLVGYVIGYIFGCLSTDVNCHLPQVYSHDVDLVGTGV